MVMNVFGKKVCAKGWLSLCSQSVFRCHEPTDLIYEGIATYGYSFMHNCLSYQPTDLIYEGIATRTQVLERAKLYGTNRPDLRRDCDAHTSARTG